MKIPEPPDILCAALPRIFWHIQALRISGRATGLRWMKTGELPEDTGYTNGCFLRLECLRRMERKRILTT